MSAALIQSLRHRSMGLMLGGVLCLPLAGLNIQAAQETQATRIETAMPGSPAQTNGFFSLALADGKLTALQADLEGKGNYGPGLIAAGGSWSGIAAAELSQNELRLKPSGTEVVWELPFVSPGFYDADRHLNYPDPETTEGAEPLVLPIRRLVTNNGQELLIEFFKRHHHKGEPSWALINTAGAGQLLLVGDKTLGYDLLLTVPGTRNGTYKVFEDKLALTFGDLAGDVTLKLLPHGQVLVPGEEIVHPRVTFTPEFDVRDGFTGKTLPASEAASDLFRQGLYWLNSIFGGGDWGQATSEYVTAHDPRSPVLKELRTKVLSEMGTISYDRFGHFGLKHAWGQFPDYGAGGLMNVPENNAAWDWRMIHLNGQWALTLATYTLRTGDTSVLNARRGRWLATDSEPSHPLAAFEGKTYDMVLASGDVRLDRKPSTTVFTLGQSFTAGKPFKSITLRLGVDGNQPAEGVVTVRRIEAIDQPFVDTAIVQTTFTLQPSQKDDKVTFELPAEQPAGTYFVEIADTRSTRNKYFGAAITWFSDYETDYTAGLATHGPLVGGTNYDRAKLLMDYIIEHAGGATENLQSYINDPKYNLPNQKSGRPHVSTAGTFWERTAGGHDMQEGLYYNAGLAALVELARVVGNEADVAHYGELHRKANEAFQKYYWINVTEDGKSFSRFFGTKDWDGAIHDYGYTYENLEALARDIGTPQQARDVIWWLDRGSWSEDGGKTWQPDIFSVWGIAAPYNTIDAQAYPNVTGTLPYRQVVTNGGTRLDIAAREYTVRSKYVSLDNMHERTAEVLGRSINPDRLTGGRTVADPGGRGRWHFGPPNVDRADIEGYREIFPTNGVLISSVAYAYLGAEALADGLWLAPELPTALDTLKLENIGFGGSLLSFEYTAERTAVGPRDVKQAGDAIEFSAAAPFHKAGVKLSAEPDAEAHVSLTLERRDGDTWTAIATSWQSHVKDGQTVYVAARATLEPGTAYRLRAHDLQGASLAEDSLALLAEQTTAQVTQTYPAGGTLTLRDAAGQPLGEGAQVTATVAPGERIVVETKP